jgi:hypothetical protein
MLATCRLPGAVKSAPGQDIIKCVNAGFLGGPCRLATTESKSALARHFRHIRGVFIHLPTFVREDAVVARINRVFERSHVSVCARVHPQVKTSKYFGRTP